MKSSDERSFASQSGTTASPRPFSSSTRQVKSCFLKKKRTQCNKLSRKLQYPPRRRHSVQFVLEPFYCTSRILSRIINYFTAMLLTILISYATPCSLVQFYKHKYQTSLAKHCLVPVSATYASTSILVIAALKESTNVILLLSQALIRLVQFQIFVSCFS